MRGGGNGSSDLNGHAIFLGGGGNVGGGGTYDNNDVCGGGYVAIKIGEGLIFPNNFQNIPLIETWDGGTLMCGRGYFAMKHGKG